MPRSLLDESRLHPTIREKVAAGHADIVGEVKAAIESNAVVVVGLAWNPHVSKARKILDAAGIAHVDLVYGNYTNQWRRRNALKMWTGWPTFPMVFVKGVLVGGANELEKLAASGELARMLA